MQKKEKRGKFFFRLIVNTLLIFLLSVYNISPLFAAESKNWYWFLGKSPAQEKIKDANKEKTENAVVITNTQATSQPVAGNQAAQSSASTSQNITNLPALAQAQTEQDLYTAGFGNKHWFKTENGNGLHATLITPRVTRPANLEATVNSYCSYKAVIGKLQVEKENSYDKVFITADDSWKGVPGSPVLPVKTVTFLVPYGQEVTGVRIIPGKLTVLSGSYYVTPAQMSMPLSVLRQAKFVPPDKSIYTSDTTYPRAPSGDAILQKKAGYNLLFVNLYPVQYRPKSKKIIYYKEMRVQVETLPATVDRAEFAPKPDPQLKEEITKLVDNPQALETYPIEQASAGAKALSGTAATSNNFQYVILTTNALKNINVGYSTFQDLIAARQAQGITATIVTVENDIYPFYTGKDNPEKIRNFIRDYYLNHDTKYVLLAGDINNIPARFLYVEAPVGATGDNLYKTSMPSDLYYACLDGTFDGNGNGIYGEPDDGVNLLAEVAVGRAPVSIGLEVSNFVRKTLNYEASNDPYLSIEYTVGEDMGESWEGVARYSSSYMEEIRLGSSAHSYTTVGFENSPYASFFDTRTLYDSASYSWQPADLINIMNSGVQIINHLGHANEYYDMKLNTTNFVQLVNNKYFLGFDFYFLALRFRLNLDLRPGGFRHKYLGL